MFARDLVLFGVNAKYLQSLLQGITTDEAKDQPVPGINTPFWITGHLAIATDYARQLLGEEMKCPKAWHTAFGPGSTPGSEHEVHATLEELLASVRAGHTAITTLLPGVNEAWAAQPNPVDFLAKNYPSTGDLMAHLLTTHEGIHLGQLSAWRRIRGLPPVSIG